MVVPPPLLPGGWVELPGRGRAWVWDSGPGGPPGSPALLLLHGWTSTAALNWSGCFGPLSSVARVVAMDHRGHGRGIRSLRPFTLESCADDVAALVEELGTGPVVAAGYSMGGPVAQLLWRRHPHAVTGLVLCATAASFGAQVLPPLALQGLGLGLSLALAALPPHLRREGTRRLTRRTDGVAGLQPWVAEELSHADPVSFVQAAAALLAFDSGPWIAEVDRPTTVVVTTRDRTVAPARQRELAGAIPGARLLEVDGDHRACVDAPDFVAALVEGYHHAATP
jgi:3-oxoadipate enol-lactonase